MLAAESYWELMRSAPHWAMEFTVEIVSTIIGAILIAPIARRWIKRHDAAHHPEIDAIPEHYLRVGAVRDALDAVDVHAVTRDAIAWGEEDPGMVGILEPLTPARRAAIELITLRAVLTHDREVLRVAQDQAIAREA